MNGALRIFLVVCVAYAAGLGFGCGGPNEGPATGPIAGVVRDKQGLPIPTAWIEWEGHPRRGHSPAVWRSDVHGKFEIDEVTEGPVKLIVTAGNSKKAVVETRAGVRDLVVVLDPGPQLLLRIDGYVPGRQERYARVTWKEPGGAREVRHAPIRDDGWTRFVSLPPDREFELWAQVQDDGRLVRARGLVPGESERLIKSEGFKDIAGKVRASEALFEKTLPGDNFRGPLREHLDIDVFADSDFLVAETSVRKDGSFRVHGLPPGTYLVSLSVFRDILPGVEKQVEAGTTDLVIDLK